MLAAFSFVSVLAAFRFIFAGWRLVAMFLCWHHQQ
jgi:hypothetical protein